MKKNLFIILISIFATTSIANAQFQVFGAANSMETNTYNMGINPFTMIYNGDNVNGHKYIASNFYAGLSLNSNIDARLKIGIFRDSYETSNPNYSPMFGYAGIELETRFINTGRRNYSGLEVSFTTGVHSWKSMAGFDGTINISYRRNKNVYFYTGFDADVNYEVQVDNGVTNNKAIGIHYWVPVGLQIKTDENIDLIIEADIPIQGVDNYVIGAGLNFYFRR